MLDCSLLSVVYEGAMYLRWFPLVRTTYSYESLFVFKNWDISAYPLVCYLGM